MKHFKFESNETTKKKSGIRTEYRYCEFVKMRFFFLFSEILSNIIKRLGGNESQSLENFEGLASGKNIVLLNVSEIPKERLSGIVTKIYDVVDPPNVLILNVNWLSECAKVSRFMENSLEVYKIIHESFSNPSASAIKQHKDDTKPASEILSFESKF